MEVEKDERERENQQLTETEEAEGYAEDDSDFDSIPIFDLAIGAGTKSSVEESVVFRSVRVHDSESNEEIEYQFAQPQVQAQKQQERFYTLSLDAQLDHAIDRAVYLPYARLVTEANISPPSTSVCPAHWGSDSIAFRCLQCEYDSNCIICPDCYFP